MKSSPGGYTRRGGSAGARGARRVGGTRDHPGVQAAEERGNEIESRRIHQESALSRLARLSQSGGNRLRLGIQRGIGEALLLLVTLREEDVGRSAPPSRWGALRGGAR